MCYERSEDAIRAAADISECYVRDVEFRLHIYQSLASVLLVMQNEQARTGCSKHNVSLSCP